jgi:ectoine hydroxylase
MSASPDPYVSRAGGTSELVRREDRVIWGRRPGPVGATQLDRYDEHGFLVMPGLLSLAEAGALVTEAEQTAAVADPNRDDVVLEPHSRAVRSVFRVHRDNRLFATLAADPRIADVARQILDDDVYIHQSRINFKPAFEGEAFSWHSDFETWHVEDGMPRMRALSASILLTENTEHNGPLLVVPGSHRWFVRCAGVTPPDHYKQSLRSQHYGSPDRSAIAALADGGRIASVTGPPGTVVFFDCNLMHASAGNMTPMPRHNAFIAYNSIHNGLVAPFGGVPARPAFLAEREIVPLRAASVGTNAARST